jgi:membrane protein DedA with SNARE-associated domain
MNLETFLQQIVSFTATLDPRMAILLFLLCAIGEVGLAIPYILESIWLLVGFNIGAGEISPWHVIILWLSAQAGRQVGTIGLYYIARLGMPALNGFYHKIRLDGVFKMLMARAGAVNRINLASPFSVAFGRMIGMRIPMLLIMAAKKRLGMLSFGVLLSSIIWDALYMAIGAIFGSTVDIEPGYMLLISVGGLTVIYLATFTIRMLVKRKRKPAQAPQDISTGV